MERGDVVISTSYLKRERTGSSVCANDKFTLSGLSKNSHPLSHGLIVVLVGTTDGLLITPPTGAPGPADRVGLVDDPELAFDYCGDAFTRPDVPGKPERFRS